MSCLERISPVVKGCGCAAFGKGIINPWRVISDHEYFLFEEGLGYLEIEGIEYECPESSYVIIPCGQRHISYAISTKVQLHWGHFDWTNTEDAHPTETRMEPVSAMGIVLSRAPDFVPKEIQSGMITDQKVYLLSRQLINARKSRSATDKALANAIALELLIRMLSPSLEEAALVATNDHGAIAEETRRQLTQAAHEPLDTSFSIEQVLTSGGYSYSRQQRIFRKTFGISPLHYVTLLRVERIKQLLADTRRLPSCEIARIMGFNDTAYFTRYVKKHLGNPPGKARKELS